MEDCDGKGKGRGKESTCLGREGKRKKLRDVMGN